ncbi:MAG: hypothetical protein C4B56_02315 [Candidatus Methanophagaceae archaeon]|nr:MAG: hypothetical protein C4B56_02315 [Methanophagales archaeon]
MPEKRKPYEEGSLSLIDIVTIAIDNLKTLSESGKISDKLIAFSLVLFILILGLDISYWLGSMTGITPNEPFLFAIIFAVSMIFSFIGSIGYGAILESVSNLPTNKIEPLRIGVMTLFTDLSLAIIGTLFWIKLLVNASAIILGAPIITILIAGFIGFPAPTEDKTVKPKQLREILGGLASIITIVNFIIWLCAIAIRTI